MTSNTKNPFVNGSTWLRADFHLHTNADKEFEYAGDENFYVSAYVDQLKEAGIGLGVITNHNKFDFEEFKALSKNARKEGIGLLPGVELSVNDGANGVHTLVIFSNQWIENGEDYISQFLGNAFTGKTRSQYEQENGRTNQGLLDIIKTLESYHREFFVIFAHVEAPSGLWSELDGGRLIDLGKHPLIERHCRAFQKVRTHDKPDAKCRTKVKQWWANYPAEVEGSDPKKISEIGRGQPCYLKIGDFSFDAVKFALIDFHFRVCNEIPRVNHSHINAVRFEGGLLDGVRIPFSPNMNCLIGIQGSGKSSILESVRYALNIPFGEKSQDKDYKEGLLPYVLKSGGKVVVEATDRHGNQYEIRRILSHTADVYFGGLLQPGVSVRETIVCNPLYFGQKDLSAAGKGFGRDLVEKLIGDELIEVRKQFSAICANLKIATDALESVQSDAEILAERRKSLADIKFRLQQFDKHGIKDKLDKQVEFKRDAVFREKVDEVAKRWHTSLALVISNADESVKELALPESKANEAFFKKIGLELIALQKTVIDGQAILNAIETIQARLVQLHDEFDRNVDAHKDEFAEVERDLVKALADQGITSIQPDAYVKLTETKVALEAEIVELEKNTAKHSDRHNAVLKIIAELNDAWLTEFTQIAESLEKINVTQTALKVRVHFKEEKTAFREKLEDLCRGGSFRKETLQSIVDQYADFAAIYKDLDVASMLTKSKADLFKEKFNENLFDLLSFQVPNRFEVTYHDKPLTSHSLGQRASAMMLFLLSQNDNDLLLIDQPEDDLDSQTVYDEVVKLVRSLKMNRQFIFATHNANFPVLGDSEIVSSCSYADTIQVVSGSIDAKASQISIVDIMEGGKEAFARRKAIYEIWDAN